MSSNIRRSDNNFYRPNWRYCTVVKRDGGCDFPGHETAMLEMLESTRNVLEDIQRSQMLQCDVAWAIKKMSAAIIRIDKRLQKVEGMKLR